MFGSRKKKKKRKEKKSTIKNKRECTQEKI